MEWQEDRRGRKGNQQSHPQRKSKAKWKNATTFYVTNLPEGNNQKDLVEVFREHGQVVDAYVSSKKTNMGNILVSLDSQEQVTFQFLKESLTLSKWQICVYLSIWFVSTLIVSRRRQNSHRSPRFRYRSSRVPWWWPLAST
jgi:hypothetical protein